MNINQITLETQMLLQHVAENNWMRSAILFILLPAAALLAFHYVWERWTFIPRKRGTRVFRERF